MSVLVQKGNAQGRPMALAVTIAVHVALVAGLLAMKVVDVASESAPVIHLTNLDEEHKPVARMEPIEPVLGNPAAMPQPVVLLPQFSEEAISVPVIETPREAVVPETQPVFNTSAVTVPVTPLRYQAVRPSDDYYPPQAIRRGVEGAAIVRACVDAAGLLSAAPVVVRSSRESLLDAAAVKWASEALRFQPATQDGVAVAACKEFRVSFALH